MIKIIILIMAVMIFTDSQAGASFTPWDADVKVADENFKNKPSGKEQAVSVYSAPQCAAFFLIRFFQIVISPQDGPNCRFRPTCSTYGKNAVLKHGALIGSFLAGDRLIRCNPYTAPGHDPVPEEIFK